MNRFTECLAMLKDLGMEGHFVVSSRGDGIGIHVMSSRGQQLFTSKVGNPPEAMEDLVSLIRAACGRKADEIKKLARAARTRAEEYDQAADRARQEVVEHEQRAMRLFVTAGKDPAVVSPQG